MSAGYPGRRVGDLSVFPIGFGAMRLALEGRPDEATATRTIHAALDGGVRLVDTAVNYGASGSELGYCDELVARALRSWSGDPEEVLVVAKGGNLRTDELQFVQDGSPENLRRSCELSLRCLGTECIGLYLLHSIDPRVPLADSLGALAELQAEGKIRRVGISNAGRRQLAEARTVVGITAVENQLSPWVQNAVPVAKACEAAGIAFLSWSPLGGPARAATLAETPAIAELAHERGVSPQQVALAWALALSPAVIPVVAARRPETILDSIQAASLVLTGEEMALLARPTT